MQLQPLRLWQVSLVSIQSISSRVGDGHVGFGRARPGGGGVAYLHAVCRTCDNMRRADLDRPGTKGSLYVDGSRNVRITVPTLYRSQGLCVERIALRILCFLF